MSDNTLPPSASEPPQIPPPPPAPAPSQAYPGAAPAYDSPSPVPPHYGYASPAPQPQYPARPQDNSPQQRQYGAPQQPYGAPQQQYGAPQQQQQHGAPQQQQQYGAPQQGAYGYGTPSYPVAARPTSGLAVTSLVCAIASVVFSWLVFPILAAIVAVITGHMALKLTKNNAAIGGRGVAFAGLIIGYIMLGFLALGVVITVISFAFFGAFTIPFLVNS